MKHLVTMTSVIAAGVLFGTTAQAAGDAAAGKDVFKQCVACHTVETGKNKVGPSLHGVVGRKAAAIDGFKYSKPMQDKSASGLAWTPENLKAYIMAPKEVVPGGTMAFAGLKDEKKLDDLVAYLAEQK